MWWVTPSKTDSLYLFPVGYCYYRLIIVQTSFFSFKRNYKFSPFRKWLNMSYPNVWIDCFGAPSLYRMQNFLPIFGVLAFGPHLALNISILSLVDREVFLFLNKATAFCLPSHISSFFVVFEHGRDFIVSFWQKPWFMLFQLHNIPMVGIPFLLYFNPSHLQGLNLLNSLLKFT